MHTMDYDELLFPGIEDQIWYAEIYSKDLYGRLACSGSLAGLESVFQASYW